MSATPSQKSLAELKEIFSSPPSVLHTVEIEKNGQKIPVTFELRPMDNATYAAMGNCLPPGAKLPGEEGGIDTITSFGTTFYPMMKAVFPYCCVNPRITDGVSKDSLNINDIPMTVCSEIFAKIMEISGFTAEIQEKKGN